MLTNEIRLDAINIGPQIRTRNGFDEESLRELAETIKRYGVLQPVVVRADDADPGRFQLIAGERRVLAASLAGLEVIPATVKAFTAEQAQTAQAIENLQRTDLTLFDRAAGVQAIVNRLGAGGAAGALGKSKAWVSKHLAAAKLPEDVRLAATEGGVEDTEVLASVAALMKRTSPAGVACFQAAMQGLADGSLGRQRVRQLLDQANESDQAEHDADDAGEDAEGDDDADTTASTPAAEKPVSVKIDQADAHLIARALKAWSPTKRADYDRRDALLAIFARGLGD